MAVPSASNNGGFVSGIYTEIVTASRREGHAISRALSPKLMIISEVLADLLACGGGVFAACSLYPSLNMDQVAATSVLAGLLMVHLLERDGAYRRGGRLLQIRTTEHALRIPAQSLLLLLLCDFFLHLKVPYAAFLIALILLPLLLIFEKQMLFVIMQKLHARDLGVDRVVVYGSGEAARNMVPTLLHSPRLGLRPVAVIDDDSTRSGERIFKMSSRRYLSVSLERGPVTADLLRSYQRKLLIVSPGSLSPEKLTAAAQAAKRAGLEVALLIDPTLEVRPWTESTDPNELFASTDNPPFYYAAAKRTADLIGSSLLLLLLAPVFLLIATLVCLDSPGPILFVQKRVGRNGELFDIYKFRSMHTTAQEYDLSPTQSCDTRITAVGRVLRRSSLDELPQLINVFLGDMSLVGPRPEMPFIVRDYDSRQRQRLQVVPGITGLWQLSADRAFPIHENIHYDLSYIQNRSFFMDLAILLHTPFHALRGV